MDGVGPVIAASVVRWFDSAVEPVGGGAAAGGRGHPGGARVRPERGDAAPSRPRTQTLAGKSVVVTGTLEGFTREEAEEAILARGGKSPGTCLEEDLCPGGRRQPGASKVTKAETLGVPMMDGDGSARGSLESQESSHPNETL